jgi:Phage integrase family
LQAALDRLADADILLVQGPPPDSDYRFTHALIQDAAYENLLRSRRQVLHRHVGGILRDQFAGTTAAQPELLARHFTHAGMTEAAIEWWGKAGQRSLERSANAEAIAHFTNGIQLTQALPAGQARDERELALQLALGPALMATRGYGAAEVEETYARARELCRHLGSGPNLFAALRGLWEHYELRARMDNAKEIAGEVFAIAEQSGDRTLLLVAHDVVGDTSLWVGDFAAAVVHTQRAIELYDPERDRELALAHGRYDPTMACRIFGAHALWYMGYPDRGLHQCQDAVTFARALDHPPTLAFVSQIAMHHYLRGEALPAEAHAQVVLDLALRHDFKFWLGHATVSHGWAAASEQAADVCPILQQFEPHAEVPDDTIFGRIGQRLAPHIYSDQEIVDLLAAARRLGPARGLRGATYETLFGLIASTGLRVSEAVHLQDADVDLKLGRLTIRRTKFAKSRQVPVHPSTTDALERPKKSNGRGHATPPRQRP